MYSLDRMMLLFHLLLLLLHSLVGLVAIWAALGRPPWFLRIAILGGLLSLGLAVPAYDLILSLGLQSAVVILLLWPIRSRLISVAPTDRGVARPTRWQFSLLDLLLASVVFAAIAAFFASGPTDAWRYWEEGLLAGLLSGACTLIAAWVALGRRFLYLRLAALMFVSTSLFVTACVTDESQFLWLRLLPLSPGPTLVVIACWLALCRASGLPRPGEQRDASSARPNVRLARRRVAVTWLARATLVSLSLGILVPLAVVYHMLINPERIPETTPPPENGYCAVAEADRSFNPNRVPDPDTATESQLRIFVTQHRQVLDKARHALDLPCQVPLEYSTADVLPPRSMRGLLEALATQGRYQEMDGRTQDAAETYLYLVRLGHVAEA